MRRKVVVACLVAVGAAGFSAEMYWLSQSSIVYRVHVRDFLARDMREQTVRVVGNLVKGSLCKVEADCGYRFTLRDSHFNPDDSWQPSWAPELPVSYEGCAIPDTFRDIPGLDVEISVEGERCQTCHDFKATQIMAKCPGKYEMEPDPKRPGHYRGVSFPPVPLCSALTPRM